MRNRESPTEVLSNINDQGSHKISVTTQRENYYLPTDTHLRSRIVGTRNEITLI